MVSIEPSGYPLLRACVIVGLGQLLVVNVAASAMTPKGDPPAECRGPELLEDGNFEAPTYPAGGCGNVCFASCGFDLPGWSHGYYTEDLVRNSLDCLAFSDPAEPPFFEVNPQGGELFVSLQGSVCCNCNNNGSITQALQALSAGTEYEFLMDVFMDPYDALTVTVGGQQMTFAPEPAYVWRRVAWSFVASESGGTIVVTSTGTPGAPECLEAGSAFIDNLSLREVLGTNGPDCDDNGIPDSCDIAAGTPDCDDNGIPDSCDLAGGARDIDHDDRIDSCEIAYGDLNLDGTVDGIDIGVLLALWDTDGSPLGDPDGSGIIGGADLAIVLAHWGYSVDDPTWYTVLEYEPDPQIMLSSTLRESIAATGLPWRVKDIATDIEFVLIPEGTFELGCISTGWYYGCWNWNLPVHSVTLTQSFYLARYEVTQAQWSAVMGVNPAHFQGQPDSPGRPVERVSWSDVQLFLGKTGMRLPTNAEWERAYRDGTTTAFHSMPGFPNGSDDVSPGSVPSTMIAWHIHNSDGATHPVGLKPSNQWGLHDMSGNVSEWVADWWDEAYYASSPSVDPPGPETGTVHVIRGGSWNNYGSAIRASDHGGPPSESPSNEIGFRPAKNP